MSASIRLKFYDELKKIKYHKQVLIWTEYYNSECRGKNYRDTVGIRIKNNIVSFYYNNNINTEDFISVIAYSFK